jgi:hypothetical protein
VLNVSLRSTASPAGVTDIPKLTRFDEDSRPQVVRTLTRAQCLAALDGESCRGHCCWTKTYAIRQ